MENEFAKIKKNLKVARDRHKGYADLCRTHRKFKADNHVIIRVKPKKSSLKLRSCAKQAPKYCKPFEILERIGLGAYGLAFPSNIRARNVYHVSLLKKYAHDSNRILDWIMIQVEPNGVPNHTSTHPQEESDLALELSNW